MDEYLEKHIWNIPWRRQASVEYILCDVGSYCAKYGLVNVSDKVETQFGVGTLLIPCLCP